MKKHKIWHIYTGFTRKEFALYCNRPLRFFNCPRQDCNFEQQNVYGAAIKRPEVPDVLEGIERNYCPKTDCYVQS